MTRTLARLTLFVFALTLSISAFAASKTNAKSEDVTLYRAAQLNGKTLPAGDYTVKCETTGSTAQVKFLRNGKEVASATGQVKQLSSAPRDAQLITTDGNGTATISEIDFAHSNTSVTFDSNAISASGGN